MTIAIIDYGRGNLFSIGQALRHLDAEYIITSDPAQIAAADRIILPGVGAFGEAMAWLQAAHLVDVLRDAGHRGIPFLGICLGMQLLTDRSEEFGDHVGLGLIPGVVRRLPEGRDVRIPNVGWRELEPRPSDPLLGDLPDRTMMYFVHSYAPVPTDPTHIGATINVNGQHVAVAIRRGNVIGYQFHPEKSGPQGLELIRRFISFGQVPA